MRIYTLWHEGEGGDIPWLVGAVDEFTVDEHNGFPPEYAALRKDARHRELIVNVPQKAVSALFEAPEVKGQVVEDGR